MIHRYAVFTIRRKNGSVYNVTVPREDMVLAGYKWSEFTKFSHKISRLGKVLSIKTTGFFYKTAQCVYRVRIEPKTVTATRLSKFKTMILRLRAKLNLQRG